MTIILYIAAYLFVGVAVAGVVARTCAPFDRPDDTAVCAALWPFVAVFLVLGAVVWLIDTGVRIIGGDKR